MRLPVTATVPQKWDWQAEHCCSHASTSTPLDTLLSFVSWSPCIWYVGHGRHEANKRSIDSKRGVTGDNYPTHNRPCQAVASLDSRK